MRALWMVLLICFLLVPALAAPSAGHAQAPAKNPPEESNVDYFWRKSDEAFHKGDYERCVGLHKAIAALDPSDVENYGVCAWLLWSMGRGEEAVQFMDRGLKANPKDWQMWNEAGEHFSLQKLTIRTRDAFDKAVQLIPPGEDSQMLRRRLAHAQEGAGDWPGAEQTWTGLVRDFPTEVVNKNNLARVQREIENQKTATPALSGTSGVVVVSGSLLAALVVPAWLARPH